MNRGVSSTTRQLMEQQIKANLSSKSTLPYHANSFLSLTCSSVVYPNALPNVLATEVRMVESKAFATAMSRGNYLINVSTYIETHKERINGAQYVQRIPKFTRQEENARRAKVRESLGAGEGKMAQHASKQFQASNVAAKPPYMPQTAPSSNGLRSSAPPLLNRAQLSRQSAAVTTAQLGQPSPAIAACSDPSFAMRNTPHGRRLSEQKILEATEALEKEKLKAMNTHREQVLKHGRDTALCAHRAVARRTPASQRPQTQANQARDMNDLKTNQVRVMQSLQSHAEKPQSIQPQAQQILAQPVQNPMTFQMQRVQGLNALQQQALQSKALQTRETKTGLQTQQTQEPSQLQQHSQMVQHGSQLHDAERRHSNTQSKSQEQIQGKAFAFPHGPKHPQVITPPDANPLSQTQPPRFTDDLDQLQTIEQRRNEPQINNSLENLIRLPFQTLRGNQALPEMNHATPHLDDAQAQILVRNQRLPVTSSVPQVQSLQSQPPPEMLTDEALQRLSPDQLRSLLKQAYEPSLRGFQAPPKVQNVNVETRLNQTSNHPILQLSAVRQQTGGSSGLLSQQQALKQAHILQSPAFHLPMASPNDKRNEKFTSTGQQNQGVLLHNDRICEQELPLQIARNQVRPLQPDQKTGRVSSVQETLAAQIGLPPASAPRQQLVSNTASQNLSYPKQYSESVIPDLARAAVRLEARGRSKNSCLVTPTQRRGTSQAAGRQEVSKHVDPGLTSKSNELMHTMPGQNSGSPLPMSREKQVLLANWITFQRDYRTRLERIIPTLETLFAPNPTENEKRTLRNIQTVRNVLHQSTTRLAESRSANSNYHTFMALARNVFRKYSKYEHMTRAQVAKEGRSRNLFAEGGSSQEYPVKVPQSAQKSTLNRASGSLNSALSVDIREQDHSRRESLIATAEQINDICALAQQNQVPGNARRQEQHLRQLPARQLVNRPDPKRVQAIVQQHIKTSVEKKVREYLALAASPHANPEQTEMTRENMNDLMEQTNGQPNMTFRAIDNPTPGPSSLVAGKHVVPEGNEAKAKAPSTSNLLTKTFRPVTSGQAKMANASTDNHREQLRYPDDGNFRTQRADVQGIDATAQQNTDNPANRGNQEATLENSGKVEKNSGTSQAVDNLTKEIEQSICRFQKAVDEDPVLNGSVRINKKDTRTNEEALSDLQDLLDGKRPRKRSARVEETLIDMEEYREESEDAEIKELEPAAKKWKKLTLREQVELDCERVQNLDDSVKCLIQEEHQKLLVLCSINMREHKIPILKISVLGGYPSVGKVHYNLETPSSGWLPPFDIMRSRFTEFMRSETGDCCIILVVGKWLTVVQSVLLTE